MSQKCEEEQQKAKNDIQSAVVVSLTGDPWMSFIMEAYLVVTGNYIDETQTMYQCWDYNTSHKIKALRIWTMTKKS